MPTRAASFLLVTLLAWPAGLIAIDLAERQLDDGLIEPSRVAPIPVWSPPRLIPITVTAEWDKVRHLASARALRSDPVLWQRMHLDDWDRVPSPLREQSLMAMFERHQGLLANPHRWQHLTAIDWDQVPHPVRIVAFVRMLEHWRVFYRLGEPHNLSPRLVGDTLAAIVMAESYFEHRATYTNQWGNRDLGLAAASDRAREKLEELYAAGRVDFTLHDDEYFNPWHATRFVVVWTRRLLKRLDGNLAVAIGAYHRGERNACDEKGERYRADVERRRAFFQDRSSGPPAWRFLWSQVPRPGLRHAGSPSADDDGAAALQVREERRRRVVNIRDSVEVEPQSKQPVRQGLGTRVFQSSHVVGGKASDDGNPCLVAAARRSKSCHAAA